jgi:hypothetical protein
VGYDAEIIFDWGQDEPGSGMPADNFSVRWTKQVELEAGRYRFWAYADDGVRVYLDGSRLIDEWHEASGETYERTIDLAAGSYTAVVEYYERGGSARISAGWERQ